MLVMSSEAVQFDAAQALALARKTFEIEAAAVLSLADQIGPEFARAVQLMLACRGRVVVMGMGKSGHIGRKIAATLSSTGTPAMFVHPAEASHGDLGMIKAVDLVLAISNSGESAELTAILPVLSRQGVPLVAITGGAQSSLASHARVTLNSSVAQEACPLNLAPTASTTAQLAIGDALAVALLEQKGFRREDFARLHPGGALGRRLVTRVDAVMVTEPLPVLAPGSTLRQALVVLAKQRGIVLVVDGERTLHGVLTAGDLTRLMEREADVFSELVERVLTRRPQGAHTGELASAVAFRMETHGIMAMPVLDADERLVGVAHLHDLMRARVA